MTPSVPSLKLLLRKGNSYKGHPRRGYGGPEGELKLELNLMSYISYWFMLMTFNYRAGKRRLFSAFESQNNYFHADFLTCTFIFIPLNN
jgi:hypothetical protein